MEAVVDIRVVDQAFPSHRRSGFLQVGTHDYEKIVGIALLQFQKAIGVIESSGRVVDGARADDDKQTLLRVCAIDDGDDIVTSGKDGSL